MLTAPAAPNIQIAIQHIAISTAEYETKYSPGYRPVTNSTFESIIAANGILQFWHKSPTRYVHTAAKTWIFNNFFDGLAKYILVMVKEFGVAKI